MSVAPRPDNIKEDVGLIEKRGLFHIAGPGGRAARFKPWLGDAFSFLYDTLMSRMILPNKLEASMDRHLAILRRETDRVHGERVLELGTGSGSAARFLPSDNSYTGTDISPGLLRRAKGAFEAAGFREPRFYVAGADDLPFTGGAFSTCLCVLTLNFLDDAGSVLREAARVMVPGGRFVCCVPVPERAGPGKGIRGTLRTGEELARLFESNGFAFSALPDRNGAILYFTARCGGRAK